MAKLLVYNVDDAVLNKLKNASVIYNFIIRRVSSTEYDYNLGDLLRLPEKTDILNSDVLGSLIIMCDFPDVQLDSLLKYLKAEKVKINLKAVMTPTNRFWNSLKIFEELNKEKLYFENK